ncbi:ABC transporter substrate-binding protein [Pseudomonas typographi]|uniref:ABC transporter substrate-binding protein n=1 Tax=Pseudomonas typographi TaxID=2715964 RepID=A0ABR7YWU3_9PSED|nr:ABC transporter substrate-binding protein [Pseudomonas typographi]MBD1586179.1 ABC transporter substrate-binding protein [Pseudomonas typographi]MBD1597650.1 ABC transporter substrate-binding protein [Pseudomonas typographi]
MPLISAPAKRLRFTLGWRGLLGGAALLLAQVATAANALQVGDQSGLIQALLHAAGEDTAVPYSLVWHPFPAGPALLEALNAGAIDAGVVGNAPPVFAQAGGFDVRIIGVAQGAQNNNALLLPEGSSVRQVADLKGRRVAVAKGSSGHYLLLAALRQAGLGPHDVNLVYASPVDAQNAFASGHLDAWAVWYPFVGQATGRGARVLVDGSAWAETGTNFTVASVQALNDPSRAQQLADWLVRLARAQAWATAHPAEWGQALAGITRLPLALVQRMLAEQHLLYVPIDPAIIALQQRLADAFAAERLIPRPVKVQEMFDPRFNASLPSPR